MVRKSFTIIGSGIAALLLLSACATAPAGPDSTVSDQSQRVVGAEPTGPAPGSPEDFARSAQNMVNFAFDRYDLSPRAQAILRNQASWLRAHPEVAIRIEGNCDERGTREYNLALGARRASAAKDFLVSQGIDASRILTVSNGKEEPKCTESNETCWARNRNAETLIVGSGA